MKSTLILHLLIAVISLNSIHTCVLAQARYQSSGSGKGGKVYVPPPRVNNKRFYSARAIIPKNQIKVNVLGLGNRFQAEYERKLSNLFTAGAAAFFYYAGDNRGSMRFEQFGKLFVQEHAPLGCYISLGFTQLKFENKEIQLGASLNEPPTSNTTVRPKTQFTIKDQRSFSTVGGYIGVGFESFLGRRKNVCIDFSFGYQNYLMPKSQQYGKEVNGILYNRFKRNDVFNTIAFPLYTRLSLGYAF